MTTRFLLPRILLTFGFAWPLTLFCWLGIFFVLLPLPRSRRYDVMGPMARLWGRALLWVLGIRLVFENASTMAQPGPRVMIFNHSATLDVMWVSAIWPDRGFGIGKRELMFIPGLNLLWAVLGFVFLDRKNARRAMRDLDRACERMHHERLTLVISPEGTRSLTAAMGEFKKGAFRVAMRAGVKLHPVVVTGAYECMPKYGIIPMPGEVRIRYLEPVDVSHWDESRLDEHVLSVRQGMIDAQTLMSKMVPKIRPQTT